MAKQRPDKYEKKVAIDASFEDAMKAFSTPVNTVKLDGDFKYYAALVKGAVTLDKDNPKFPKQDELFSKDFSSLKVSIVGHGAIIIRYAIGNNIRTRSLTVTKNEKEANAILPMPAPTHISFELDLTKFGKSLELQFQFVNQV